MSDENMFYVTPEIRARYLQRREGDVAAINQAIASGNFQIPAKLGHDWKGNGETYGFPQFSEWGKTLETASKNQQADVIKSIVAEVEKFLSSQNN
jgi:HPt (histidine-containing phosphotransfer) domain-containing protein